MAETILIPVAKQILVKLGDVALEQIGLLQTLKPELSKLEDSVSIIQAVLLDAQEKQRHNRQVKDWLEKLSDVMYDADDVLDDFFTEARRQAMADADDSSRRGAKSPTTTCWSVVRFLFASFPRRLIYELKIARGIKAIREKLDDITKDKDSLHLEIRSEEALHPLPSRETDQCLPAIVVGREDDRNEIIELLLNANSGANISVVSIVGMGGLGKTTLAQLVCDDKQVQDRFDIKVWVYVSQNFDVRVILERMLQCATRQNETGLSLTLLQDRLRKELTGKRFLFVLDDVWEENEQSWETVAKYLTVGAIGSKVLVTTRSTKVAEVGGTVLKSERSTTVVEPYLLEGLSLNESWTLLVKKAHPRKLPEDSEVKQIGLEILEKCCGVPLAVSTTSGMLISSKHPEMEWPSLLQKRLSSVVDRDGNATMLALRLSFDNLPSRMKNCFSYCKLFPKGFRFDVQLLVQLWVSQGYIESEDDGLDCFNTLWSRSFFQQVETDEFGCVTMCRMHDLMHDLADSITGEKILRSSGSTFRGKLTSKTRHLSLLEELENDEDIGEDKDDARFELDNARKVRTLICYERLSGEECRRIFRSFMLLRVLIIRAEGMDSDASIGELKHLRFLGLDCEEMETLPDSVTNLLNLQVLKVDSGRLKELPWDTRKLINLKHLHFDGSCMTHMPKGIGKLKSLQTLGDFVVGKKSDGDYDKVGGLDELIELNALRGRLIISNLVNAECLGTSSYHVLKSKLLLQSLTLDWGLLDDDDDDDDFDHMSAHDEEILEMLCPHPALKILEVRGGYRGMKFPNWLSSITNLVEISLRDCKKCEYLPPLHKLRCLKKLEFGNCPQLKGIDLNGEGDYHCESSTIRDDYEPHFKCLAELSIWHCPNLTQMPTFPSVGGRLYLIGASLTPLAKTMKMRQRCGGSVDVHSSPLACPLSELMELALAGIDDDFESLSNGDGLNGLISLQQLRVSDCSIGAKFPSSLCCSASLTTIEICKSKLVEYLPPLHEIPSLRELELVSCPNLKGCWWRQGNHNNKDYWPQFPRLSTLEIRYCPSLTRLPLFPTVGETLMLHCTSGQAFVRTMKMKVAALTISPLSKSTKLNLSLIDDLEHLPEEGLRNLTSLRSLVIWRCPRLATLPPAMQHLTSLQKLSISECRMLTERCRKGEGEDWPNIAHIPTIYLDGVMIQYPASSSEEEFADDYD